MSSSNITLSGGAGKLPLHFDGSVAPSDFPGPKTIGRLSAGFTVFLIIIDVVTAFDGSTTMTIGEDSAQGNLVTTSQVFMNLVGTYGIEINHKYTTLTDIKTFFTGSPTVGSANITIFYQ